MTALLNGGIGENGERILSESSVAAMMEYRSYTHPLLPDTTYGFEAGFQLPQAGSSDKIVTKAGDLPGFSSYLFLIPEQKTGVFISYNQNGALREWFYGQFIATFFPQYAAPAQFDDVVASTVEQLAAFNGLYADLRLGSILTSVEAVEDGQLLVRDAYLGPRTLHQIDENLFADQMLMLFTAFQVDERTGSTYMKEPYLNPLGQAGRAPEPQGFADVGADHPYAEAIYTLQSLGHYPNDGEALFDPERPLTRAEFIRLLFDVSKIVPTQSKDYAFVDIEGHVDAAYIHSAYLLGGAVGDGEGKFEPDRPITRQEAAVFIWLQLRQAYPDELFESISLAGDTSPWAVPAVKMMVALGLYGPEVVVSEDGAVDYLSRQVLTHEQSAAILYETLVQPMNLIVAELAAAAADEDESIEIKSGEVHKVEVELGDDNEAEVEAEVKIEADTEADADVDVEIEVETDPEAETEVETEPVRSP